MKAYHYCAIFTNYGDIRYADGIISTNADPFDSGNFILSIRKRVCDLLKNESISIGTEKITILSLSLLGEKQ